MADWVRRFVSLHLFAIIVHTVCAVYAFTTNSSLDSPLRLESKRVRYPTPETYEYAPYTYYYTTVSEHTFDGPSVVQIHGVVAVFTVFMHMLIYLPTHIYFSNIVWNQGYYFPRWIEYSVSCTLMSIASSMSAGNSDLNLVVVFSILGVALQGIGALTEQQKRLYIPLIGLGTIVNLAISYGTLWYLFGSYTEFNTVQTIEVLAYGFFYGLFPLNCFLDARDRPNFQRTDWIYNVLSLTSKFGLFWIQVGEVERILYNTPWTNVQIYLLGIVFPFSLLVLCIWAAPSSEVIRFDVADKDTPFRWLRRIATLTVFPEDRSTYPDGVVRRAAQAVLPLPIHRRRLAGHNKGVSDKLRHGGERGPRLARQTWR